MKTPWIEQSAISLSFSLNMLFFSLSQASFTHPILLFNIFLIYFAGTIHWVKNGQGGRSGELDVVPLENIQCLWAPLVRLSNSGILDPKGIPGSSFCFHLFSPSFHVSTKHEDNSDWFSLLISPARGARTQLFLLQWDSQTFSQVFRPTPPQVLRGQYKYSVPYLFQIRPQINYVKPRTTKDNKNWDITRSSCHEFPIVFFFAKCAHPLKIPKFTVIIFYRIFFNCIHWWSAFDCKGN